MSKPRSGKTSAEQVVIPVHLQRMKFDNVRDKPPQPPAKPVRYERWLYSLLVLALLSGIYLEYRHSTLQSLFWQQLAQRLTYQTEPGATAAVRYPGSGPYDQRAGYSLLADWLPLLTQSGFHILQQNRFSPALLRYHDWGFNPPYRQKMQFGLSLYDCRAEPVFEFKKPAYQFADYTQVAPLLVDMLLFIENRHLLQDPPYANPAIDWNRLAAAMLSQTKKSLGFDTPAAGGSTLATQIEKYQHSDQGFTSGFSDKFQQLISASTRAYLTDRDTQDSRRQIILHYLNTVPLAATPQLGEVHGLGEGLQAWFNANPAEVNRLLQQQQPSAEQGLALRQSLALIIGQRRPSYYLLQGRADLMQLVDSHLRLLRQHKLLSQGQFEAATQSTLTFDTQASLSQHRDFDKTATILRSRLASLLNRSVYQLDRLDLTAHSTLDLRMQQAVGNYLQQLSSEEGANKAGLIGQRLLSSEQLGRVRYSFTLYQSTAEGNKLRIQTDNQSQQPFDLNEGSKLELGSTAKLRMLVTYLEIIAELHQLYAEEAPEQLRFLDIAPQDQLTQWAISYLIDQPGVSLTSMLEAALERTYSADPRSSFFTGGGLHTFSNFRREDNNLTPTLRQALQESINLPFVRLTQDIVQYSIHHGESSSYQLLKNDQDPRRDQYLRRFAEQEGVVFLSRFWRKYRNQDSAQRLQTFFSGLRQTPERLAASYRFIYPLHDELTFLQRMRQQLPDSPLTDIQWRNLYKKYAADASFSLADQAYLARSHPLELWLLAYVEQHPSASLSEAITASANARQQAYQWLFRTQSRSARDTRIRTVLEVEAFWDIHQRWQRLGYPFDFLVPSLATALGSSGDRPAALAELMGIIVNDGRRQPLYRIEQLDFAKNTPYFASLARRSERAVQVLPVEVAQVLRQALAEVVTEGTGRRLQSAYPTPAGRLAPFIGGKTGTGDNRLSLVSARGDTIQSTAINRTATFAFYLADNYFGVISVYVPGSAAEGFSFTSALPLQVLNGMADILQPYIRAPGCQ
ncbi:glycosyl transferase family 51 [Arsukibacterium ikkense]|uniref:peptidoglycan glycosyltransferase n=1 Tax=Arsukibacterium ikkense TaxID=336831 RepID=A0A0M2V7V7_9GAMM|nr:transglycosylase domain-containing protein [Arsukibacterium ikkense]KKO45735.1 glycosyl transferase family 51 [Arsukibacterium ikkense]